jgi:hypothetical protein
MPQPIFDILMLIARPAAGKSEVIDYLKNTEPQQRIARFHVGEFEEIDDFPMLWTWFEEDQILAEMGHPRLHTDEQGYFKERHLWDLLIRRIELEVQKKRRDLSPDQVTIILEFARGEEHGGFRAAFSEFSPELLSKAAVIYLNVSWEESLRKNRKRFNPERADSILEHALPDEKLSNLYRHNDWHILTKDSPEYLNFHGVSVPYVVFENEDDVTTERGDALGDRLEACLTKLWELHQNRRQT